MMRSRRPSPLLSIFLIVLVDLLGVTIILPLLPFYAEELGASPVVVGMLLSIYGLCQLLAGPVLGAWSDRVGRKRVLLISQLGTFFSFILLAFAKTLPVVFLARAIDGITAGNITVAQAYVADVTEPRNRARAFGLIGMAFGFGFLVGPAFSAFLAPYGPKYPILAAAALSALSILATTFLLRTVKEEREEHAIHSPTTRAGSLGLTLKGFAECFRNPETAKPLIQLAAFFFSFSLYFGGFALFAERRFLQGGAHFGAREVGYVFAFSGLIGLIIQGGLIHHLVKRFGELRLGASGFIFQGLGFLLLGYISSPLWVLAAVGGISYGSAVIRPTLTSMLTRATTRSRQGMALGVMQSLHSLATTIGPLAAGWLIGESLMLTYVWLGGLLAFTGFYLTLKK